MEYNEEKVEQYYQMMDDYNNDFIINQFKATIPQNSTVLELGFGTGKDYLQLKNDYQITPSDYSQAFIDKFALLHHENAIQVNAILMDINQKFDCIYSSKVLNSLPETDIIKSLINQYHKLNDNGYIFHTFWYGSKLEDDSFIDQNTLKQILELDYKYVEFKYYKEADFVDEIYDSVIIIARK